MGMFDYVDYKCDCPECGKEINEFQSKSGECMLWVLKPYKVTNFYGHCLNCGTFIDFKVIIKDYEIVRVNVEENLRLKNANLVKE